MKNQMKLAKGLVFFVFAVLVAVIKVPGVYGNTLSYDCNFQNDLKSLEQVQADTNSEYLKQVRTEAEIRKSILSKIINCSIQEVDALRSKLDEVKIADKDMSPLKAQLFTDLDGVIDYYKSETQQISNLGIQGSKNLAKELLDWRVGNYSYLAGRVVNFITWSNNQDLVRVAENRLTSIKISFLNLKTEDETINETIKEAELNLKSAKVLNQAARQAMQEFQPPEIVLDKIKDSLDGLALVYKKFFEISEIANKTLP